MNKGGLHIKGKNSYANFYTDLCGHIRSESKLEKFAGEEWIWVTGYKGMDKDMRCYNGFQYELGYTYETEDDESVAVCRSGFHFCLKLEDVYNYVSIGNGNRFFEVRALVRKSDANEYDRITTSWRHSGRVDKLASKSIEILRELTADEILAHYPEASMWSEELKRIAIVNSFATAERQWRIETLVKMGYAEPLAKYICNDRNCDDAYRLAVALNAQPDISMDTKINAIFSHI